MDIQTLRDDHALLVRAVRETGRMVSKRFGGHFESWMKSPGQPVSEVDLAADSLLKEILHGERPGYGWLSEESEESENRTAAERLWVVDPIDGTRAFLRGRPEYSVSAALMADGEPVAGAVYNPETDEFYEAFRGGGARCNGAPIAVGAAAEIGKARILVCRGEYDTLTAHNVLLECEISPASSIAYKLALVAAGTADAVVSLYPKSDWDIAAAHVLISQAGGIMTTTGGGAIVYNRPRPRHASVIAANPALHAALVEKLG